MGETITGVIPLDFAIDSGTIVGATFVGPGTLSTGGTVAVDGASLSGGAVWDNTGTVDESSGQIGGFRFTNEAGGVYDVTGDTNPVTGGTLINAGTLVSGGTALTTMQAAITDTGTIIVNAGTLAFGAGVFDGPVEGPGALELAGVSTIEAGFSHVGPLEILSGSANIALGGTTTTLNGAVTIAGAGILGPGTLATTGTVTVDGANMFGGAVWDNTGTVEEGSGQIGGFRFINEAGGVLDVTGDSNPVTGGTLTNAGTLVTGGTALTDLQAAITDTGTIIVNGGTLELAAGTFSGPMQGTGTVVFDGPHGTFADSADITTGGLTVLAVGDVTYAGTIAVSDTAAIAGTLQLEDGTISPPTSLLVENGGLVEGTGTIQASITNDGTIKADNGTLYVDGSVTGTGLFQIGSDSTLELGPTACAGTLTVNFGGSSSSTLILDNPGAELGNLTVTGIGVGDQIVLADTSFGNDDGVIAATVGSLGGLQTLQVREDTAEDNPHPNGPTLLDIPLQHTATDPSTTNAFFNVSQSGDPTATVLTLASGNPIALAVNATAAQNTFNVHGNTIKVGIISIGAEAQAMTQIVGAIAPDATIDAPAFFPTEAAVTAPSFASAIAALQAAGCNIIVDDVGGGPDDVAGGPISQAITAAFNDNISYITAAGNSGLSEPTATASFGPRLTIAGHEADPDALAVGAMNYLAVPATLSSVGGYMTPETESFSYLALPQPNANYFVTAPDGGPTSFPLPSAVPLTDNPTLLDPYFGTSEAAAVVAGIAALMMQANFALERDPGEVYKLLANSAQQFPDASMPGSLLGEGSGLVQAPLAVAMAKAFVACFCAGTLILTESGATPVECLAVGEMVPTVLAGRTPVRWIGRRRIDCRRHPDPGDVWPVRVSAGAFGPDRPRRELWLSPDHAVYVQGLLIPIRQLLNGATIVQVPLGRVTYYHVELPGHDVLLAENLPVESYLDTGNRGVFENTAAPLILHPGLTGTNSQARRRAESCVPFADDATCVEPVWRQLAERATLLGYHLPEIETTGEPALRVVVDGRTFRPIHVNGSRQVFALPAARDGVRLVSRAAAPTESRPWLDDRRRLGVAISDILLHDEGGWQPIAIDAPILRDGWWDAERDRGRLWRWTSGDAHVPFTGGPSVFEVAVCGTGSYVTEIRCAGRDDGSGGSRPLEMMRNAMA